MPSPLCLLHLRWGMLRADRSPLKGRGINYVVATLYTRSKERGETEKVCDWSTVLECNIGRAGAEAEVGES